MRSLYLLLKKYIFFSSFGAAGRLTSRGLRHGCPWVYNVVLDVMDG